MNQPSKLQIAAIDLISKYFGQNTADIYVQFFSGEPDSVVTTAINEIMVDYLGEKKAKDEISRIMESVA